jgi:hypothetical protein
MKQINIRIQDQTYALLKEKSKQQRISMNRLVDYFVSEGLSENVVAVYERMLAEYNNINGFLCLDKADARKLFQHTPTPKQQQITKEIREWLIPKPKPKPPLLKKKESINTNP